jgi:glycopeptide antibiotics resistance protein
VRIESRSDWAANILLFIPLSYLFLAALAVDRPWWVGLVAALVVLPGCTLLSAAVEFTQLYFPPRVSSLNDVVAESIGGFLGGLLWLVGGQGITRWLRQVWAILGSQGSAVRLLPAYVVFLMLLHAMPLDLTLSPVEIYHKYRDGRIQLVPFANRQADPFELVQKDLTNVAYFLPVGLLLSGLSGPAWQKWRGGLRVLGLGLGLAGLIEFGQLFVYTRFCDTTDIVTGGLAVLAGWGLGLVVRRPRPAAAYPAHLGPATHAGLSTPRAVVYCGSFLVWLSVLVFINWQPFDFAFSDGTAVRRLREMSFIPFAVYYQGNYLNSFDQIVYKVILFVPVGVLLAPLGRRVGRNLAGPLVLLVAVVLATGFEAGQLFLPTRYASVTDVLIETLGVWLGLVVARRASEGVAPSATPTSTWNPTAVRRSRNRDSQLRP